MIRAALPLTLCIAIAAADAGAVRLEATLLGHHPSGAQPTTVTFAPDGKLLVANRGDSTVSVFDLATREIERKYPIEVVGHGAWTAAVDPSHPTEIVVTNWMGENLRFFDRETGKETGSVDVGIKPSYLAFSPDGTRAYVAGHLSGKVAIVDLATRQVVRALEVGQKPMGVAASADGRWLYVASCSSNKISKIDLKHEVVLENFGAPLADTTNLALTPDGAWLLAAGENDDLLVLSTETGDVRKIGVGRAPAAVALTPDGATAMVACYRDNSVHVVDLTTFKPYHRLTTGPGCIHVATDGTRLVAANDQAGTISVYELSEPKPVEIPPAAALVAPSPADQVLVSASPD